MGPETRKALHRVETCNGCKDINFDGIREEFLDAIDHNATATPALVTPEEAQFLHNFIEEVPPNALHCLLAITLEAIWQDIWQEQETPSRFFFFEVGRTND